MRINVKQKNTHCPHGHEMRGYNVYIDGLGHKCRICVNEKNRLQRRKKGIPERKLNANFK